jgi:hypothetical protein
VYGPRHREPELHDDVLARPHGLWHEDLIAARSIKVHADQTASDPQKGDVGFGWLGRLHDRELPELGRRR